MTPEPNKRSELEQVGIQESSSTLPPRSPLSSVNSVKREQPDSPLSSPVRCRVAPRPPELDAVQEFHPLDIKAKFDSGQPLNRLQQPQQQPQQPHQPPPPPPPQSQHQPRASPRPASESKWQMVLQPATRDISQDQLVAEVKGIYAGLVLVEGKCIEVDENESETLGMVLSKEQWQALSTLHRTLLHEHHDFFLASQHPFASPALRRLASKYAMPARMWRHGIHSFLELLRHRLPGSLDHMLSFIYLAYSMMALLYETVPTFEDTWIECLGDLSRYRMAIEDDDIREREIWTSVSRQWYSKASDKSPTIGRLYHHLAILARPNALQQLLYYSKSLCVPIPFTSTKESILTLFQPVLANDPKLHVRIAPIDAAFIKVMGVIFTRTHPEKLEPSKEEYLAGLGGHINRLTRKWQESGYYVSIIISCALLGFGLRRGPKGDNVLFNTLQSTQTPKPPPTSTDSPMKDPPMSNAQPTTVAAAVAADVKAETEGAQEVDEGEALDPSQYPFFQHALDIFAGTQDVALPRVGDANVLHYVHCTLVFVFHIAHIPTAMKLMGGHVRWGLIANYLNTLLLERADLDLTRIKSDEFPTSERPLPEDYAMMGLVYVIKHYFPRSYFKDQLDDDEKFFELPSMTETRKERIIWLGYQITALTDSLVFDESIYRFVIAQPIESDPELSREMRAGSVSSFSTAGQATPTGSLADEVMLDADEEAVVRGN